MASQAYKTSCNEEYIIIGNDALMKCVIPSFVADFVSVVNWEDSEGSMIYANNNFGNDRSHLVLFTPGEDTTNGRTWFCFYQNCKYLESYLKICATRETNFADGQTHRHGVAF